MLDRPPNGRNREDRCQKEALIHGPHHILAAVQTNSECADDGCDDADATNQQRQSHERKQSFTCIGDKQSDQNHCCANGHNIGFEQVSSHTGAVADVVAYVVSDHSRVARIVFWNSGFDLADQVSANVSRFGENTAAQAGKDRN